MRNSKHSWNYNPILKNCLICHKQFRTILAKVKVGKGKFCSRKCYLIFHSANKWSQKECIYCHKKFTYRTKQKKRKCCSLSCVSKYGIKIRHRRTSVKRNCLICQKEIYICPARIKLGRGKFCSKRCHIQWQINNAKYDEEAFGWKNGLSPLYKKIRATAKYREWQRNILERDGFKCIFCHNTEHLETDHIKSFAAIILAYNIKTVKDSVLCKELFDLKNGRTLCHNCHLETPNYAVPIS